MRQWMLPILFIMFTSPLADAQTPGLMINKQPVNIVHRMFDPAKPPAEMPPFSPGETAECDSDFLSDAAVAGQARQTDATHATVTITKINVTLKLNVTIWLPNKVTQHVIEHEEGHHQISEYYYQNADKLAVRIATAYMGKQFVISGTDLRGELGKLLIKTDDEITNEYNKELNPEPTQLRFDAITDHGRNDEAATDAVAQAIKSFTPATPAPAL